MTTETDWSDTMMNVSAVGTDFPVMTGVLITMMK